MQPRVTGPYSLRIRYLDIATHNYAFWDPSLPAELSDLFTCNIVNELLLNHNIHCAQLAEDQLEFDSQRDLDFAILVLSGRKGIELF